MKRIVAAAFVTMLLTTAAIGAEQARDRKRQVPSTPTPDDVLRTYDERHPERVPLPFAVMRIGTWNTMLQPWLSNQDDVVRTIARIDLDVLALQEVWTDAAKDAIVTHPAIKRKYPYSYYTPAMQEPGSATLIPRSVMEGYITCLVAAGVDTRTIEQPETAIPAACQQIRLQLIFAPHTWQCLENTMQGLSAADSPFTAIDLCENAQGVRYSHGGNPGLLVLSKRPLSDVQIESDSTFSIRRANVYFTVSGVRFAMTQFPHNLLEELDPALGPLQSGALQRQFAEGLLARQPGVILGDFNSGPNYQRDGYDRLVAGGYKPLSSWNTYCPSLTHGNFPQCQVSPNGVTAVPSAIDNIFVKDKTAACLKLPFALAPASDHIGLAALCVLKK